MNERIQQCLTGYKFTETKQEICLVLCLKNNNNKKQSKIKVSFERKPSSEPFLFHLENIGYWKIFEHKIIYYHQRDSNTNTDTYTMNLWLCMCAFVYVRTL